MLMRLIRAMSRAAQPEGSTPRWSRHSAGGFAIALALGFSGLFLAPGLAPAASPAPKSASPIIYSVRAWPAVAHAGDSVKWDAHVSSNVVTVTARVAVYTFSLYPVRAGHFGETFVIPKDVPPFFHGHYGVTITATTASGASASRSIGLSFQ